MPLNPLDEIRNLGAPADLGGGAPPGMGGPPPDMGGPPMPGGPPMGAPPPMMPPEMGMPPDMGMPPGAEALMGEGLMEEGAGLEEEASTEDAATQVASAIVGMAPSPEEAMNLAQSIVDKVMEMTMEEEIGAEDRLMDLGLGMQFGGTVPPPRANPFTMPQQFGQQSWAGAQGAGGSGRMGPPIGGGYRDGGGIGSLMMQQGGEPTMAGGRPIQWQQGPVGQRRRQDFMNYMAPGQARRQLGRQAAAGGPGRRAVRGAGGG